MNSTIDPAAFLAEFTAGKQKLGIIGQGYVGLPLAEAFGDAGIKVLGFDIDQEKIAKVNRGESYIGDVKSENLERLVKDGMIEATDDFDRLTECGAISICVPTPLGKDRKPDMSFIEASVEAIKPRLQRGQLIVLESSTYPGTTEEYVRPALEATGLRAGQDFYLAFSPERVDPGNIKFGVKQTDKIIGGTTPTCTALAFALYDKALEKVCVVSSTQAAEMVKLLENSFRAINIGFINEFAKMCNILGVDVWEVVQAAATKPFGFMRFEPGLGVGGHCIPIDPLYLDWKLETLGFRGKFIKLADEMNTQMPLYVVGRVEKLLKNEGLALAGSRILIIGMAYKEDIEDMRESPAIEVAHALLKRGVDLVYHDPHVPECQVDDRLLRSVELSEEEIKRATLVLVATAHKAVDFQRVVDLAPRIFDAKNATGKLGIEDTKIHRL